MSLYEERNYTLNRLAYFNSFKLILTALINIGMEFVNPRFHSGAEIVRIED